MSNWGQGLTGLMKDVGVDPTQSKEDPVMSKGGP